MNSMSASLFLPSERNFLNCLGIFWVAPQILTAVDPSVALFSRSRFLMLTAGYKSLMKSTRDALEIFAIPIFGSAHPLHKHQMFEASTFASESSPFHLASMHCLGGLCQLCNLKNDLQ